MIEEIRKRINETDDALRSLLVQRMGLSLEVAECKRGMGETTVYRPEREKAILKAGSAFVAPDEREAYTAAMRGVMAASRMLQYDRMARWHGEAVDALFEGPVPEDAKGVRARFQADAGMLAVFLSVAGERGVRVTQARLHEDGACDLTILGDVSSAPFRSLLYQMAKESAGFTAALILD